MSKMEKFQVAAFSIVFLIVVILVSLFIITNIK